MTIFAKNNITSLFYVWIYAKITQATFFSLRSILNEQPDPKRAENKAKVISLLKLNLLVIASVMIFEFLMMIGHSDIIYLKSYSQWKDRVIHYLCLED